MNLKNYDEINQIENLFMGNKVKVIKYNSSLDEIVQKHVCFDAYLQLSQDRKKLIFVNKKPVEDKYILETDPLHLEKKLERLPQTR